MLMSDYTRVNNNTIVKRIRNTVVLMVNAYIDIEDEVKDITTVINLGMIDYYFADFFSLYRI